MHFNELLVESGAFEKFKSFNFSFKMAVVLSVRTEKVRVMRSFDADRPKKCSSYRTFVLQLFVLTDFFFSGLNAWPTIWPANVRTNELFVLSEFVLTRFNCSWSNQLLSELLSHLILLRIRSSNYGKVSCLLSGDTQLYLVLSISQGELNKIAKCRTENTPSCRCVFNQTK